MLIINPHNSKNNPILAPALQNLFHLEAYLLKYLIAFSLYVLPWAAKGSSAAHIIDRSREVMHSLALVRPPIGALRDDLNSGDDALDPAPAGSAVVEIF